KDQTGSDVLAPLAHAKDGCPDAVKEGGTDEPGERVDRKNVGRKSAGEGNVAERVGDEDLVAKDDEVAREPAGERDCRRSQKGVADVGSSKHPGKGGEAHADTRGAAPPNLLRSRAPA